MRAIDVKHLGRPHVICCWEVDGILVDPGPESSLPTLLEAIGGEQPRALLLTHIHLDHAAATGAMVRRWPDLEVYVHERGAPHLIDPSKLLASAERLYGERLNYLWGEILPVPEANVHVLAGGETAHGMRVAYTPGHASHHVSYLHEQTGTAFVGDVAACRIPPSKLVMPPTPPPDIDIELWEESLATIAGWDPERLALTHFGPVEDDIPGHLETVRELLRSEAALVRELSAADYEADLQRRIREQLRAEGHGEETVAELLQAVPTAYQHAGLERYWRKHGGTVNELTKAPWTLWAYVAVGIVWLVVSSALDDSLGLAPSMVTTVFFLLWSFFLLKGVRWLWIVTIVLESLSVVLSLATGQFLFAVPQLVGLGLLIAPATRGYFARD